MNNWDELKKLCSKREGSEFSKEVMNGTILALIAENERLTRDIRMLVRQHMPLDALEGMPGWSEVVEARKAVEQRDQLRSLLERAYGAVAVDQNHALLAEIDAVLRKERGNG